MIGVDVHGSSREGRKHVPDEKRAAITHENPRGRDVENEKARECADEQRERRRDEPLRCQNCGHHECKRRDRGDAARETIHVVDEVHRIDDDDDPRNCEKDARDLTTRKRCEEVREQSNIRKQRRGECDADLQKKFRPRAQRSTVIDEPNKMHRKGAKENRDPRTARRRNALEMGSETRKSLGDEIRRERRRRETCGERPCDIDFFINKDYSNDLTSTKNPDKIMESIDRLRNPIKNMGPDNQAKTLKYIQNFCKTSRYRLK